MYENQTHPNPFDTQHGVDQKSLEIIASLRQQHGQHLGHNAIVGSQGPVDISKPPR